jgi:hypothetical protein
LGSQEQMGGIAARRHVTVVQGEITRAEHAIDSESEGDTVGETSAKGSVLAGVDFPTPAEPRPAVVGCAALDMPPKGSGVDVAGRARGRDVGVGGDSGAGYGGLRSCDRQRNGTNSRVKVETQTGLIQTGPPIASSQRGLS